MHTLAVQLAPVLAAEKSKVPFYIAGGLLVLWALTVSLALGMRKADFPGNLNGQRTVSAITVVLVLAAVSTAVLTAGTPAKWGASTPPPTSPAEQAPAPTASTPATTSTPTTASTPTTTSTTTTPAASTKLSLAADPGGLLKYDTTGLRAKAGAVTITMTNMSPVEHNVTVASGSSVLGATPTFSGGSKTLRLNLKPGTYTFYCSVPGHRQAGMEGTLTVS
jgi:plastocyanin